MKPYSIDLRERVLRAYDRKAGSREKVAALFGVSLSFVRNILRLRRENGSVAPKPHGGGRAYAFDAEKQEELRALLKKDPDLTLEELRVQTGVKCSIKTVWLTLDRMGSGRKKSPSTPRNKTGPM
jgi:transposase